MFTVDDHEFNDIIVESIDQLSRQFEHVKNVAIVVEADPSLEQRQQLNLHCHQTLYGLYEGVPLSHRQGMLKILPDKITLFKNPLSAHAQNLHELKQAVHHTLWHEIGHYYGLNHDRIHELERRKISS